MNKRVLRDEKSHYSAWETDQLAKSEFFQQKLAEWGLRDVANAIEIFDGETLEWELELLAACRRDRQAIIIEW